MTVRRAICWRCQRLLIDGDPPTFTGGLCVSCGDALDREAKARLWRAARKKARKPAQTPEQLAAAGDPFRGMREGEDE